MSHWKSEKIRIKNKYKLNSDDAERVISIMIYDDVDQEEAVRRVLIWKTNKQTNAIIKRRNNGIKQSRTNY